MKQLWPSNDILRESQSGQISIEFPGGRPPMGTIGHNDQQVDIAVFVDFPASSGTKKNDTPGIDTFDDFIDQPVYCLFYFMGSVHMPPSSSQSEIPARPQHNGLTTIIVQLHETASKLSLPRRSDT